MKIALFSPHFVHMGDTRTLPTLATEFAKLGCEVHLLQAWEEWRHLEPTSFPHGLKVVDLRAHRILPVLPSFDRMWPRVSYRVKMTGLSVAIAPGLIKYLRSERPDILIVRMLTVPAILLHAISRSKTRIVISTGGTPTRSRFRKLVWPRVYPLASGFVASAEGVADRVAELSGVERSTIRVMWDPVLDDTVCRNAEAVPEHPWFSDGGDPIIVAVGRLSRQKDYATLLDAFKLAASEVPCRLVIFGTGELLTSLQRHAQQLGIDDRVSFAGFTRNPHAHMKAASVFVLSSLWEGSSHSLIEAQGMGVPQVSTDCPSGQREILMNGATGILVRVGDHVALAKAIVDLLTDAVLAKNLSTEAVKNSVRFQARPVAKKWLEFMKQLGGK